ncbi:uncharacterized protein DUF222 [Georgenia soli]|uniref:Uncharacterized protein DUF222 n=1 Tax=Georgenia soli TaxID=638953 RepID=A0A2A9EJW8_9MICO|nr:uncharacterized protein DUF222 [Georgenia soli]
MARARELSTVGLAGLGVLLEAGDPWAQEVLADLIGPDDSPATATPTRDAEGAAVLAGLAPAGFTRAGALPDDDAGHGNDAADEPGTGTGGTACQVAGAGDAADGDADGDGVGAAEGVRPAWSRALRRRMETVFDPGEDVSVLGVGIAALAGMRAGPDLAAVLTGTQTRTLGRAAGIEVLAAHRRIESWAAGQVARAAAGLSDAATFFAHPAVEKPVDVTAEEIAMRLAVSRQEARTLITVGHGLTRTFTETAAAVAAGVVDYPKARAIVTTLATSPVPVAVQVEHDVLEEADGRTVAQVRRDLAKALVQVDPADAQARHARARAKRHVNHTRALPDGMGSIYAVLPAQDCVQVDLTLDAIAHTAKHDGDPRTIDQLRADALLALTHAALLTGHTGPEPAENHGAADDNSSDDVGVPATPPPSTTESTSPPPGADVTAVGQSTPCSPGTGTGTGAAVPTCGTTAGGDGQPPPTPSPAPPGLVPGGPPGTVEYPPLHQLLLRHPDRFAVPDITVHVTVPLATVLPPDTQPEGTALPTADPEGTAASGRGSGVSPGGPDTDPGAGLAATTGDDPAVPHTADTDAADDPEPAEAAHLDGYGPITPDIARALAAGGTWRRLITDPLSGVVTDLGRTRYRPPAALQDLEAFGFSCRSHTGWASGSRAA